MPSAWRGLRRPRRRSWRKRQSASLPRSSVVLELEHLTRRAPAHDGKSCAFGWWHLSVECNEKKKKKRATPRHCAASKQCVSASRCARRSPLIKANCVTNRCEGAPLVTFRKKNLSQLLFLPKHENNREPFERSQPGRQAASPPRCSPPASQLFATRSPPHTRTRTSLTATRALFQGAGPVWACPK